MIKSENGEITVKGDLDEIVADFTPLAASIIAQALAEHSRETGSYVDLGPDASEKEKKEFIHRVFAVVSMLIMERSLDLIATIYRRILDQDQESDEDENFEWREEFEATRKKFKNKEGYIEFMEEFRASKKKVLKDLEESGAFINPAAVGDLDEDDLALLEQIAKESKKKEA